MIDTFDLMLSLDQLRIDMKISIGDLTDQVISRRNYSRYLSGELTPTFKTIEALLRKMNVSMLDFATYATNFTETGHNDELLFREALRLDNIEEAYEKFYQSLKNKKCKTCYAKKTIPIGLIYINYRHRKIIKSVALQQMKKIINLDALIKSKIIDDDTIEALHLYTKIADDFDKKRIISYLTDVIFKKEYKLFVVYYQQTTMMLYITALRALTTLQTLTEDDHVLMDKILKEALDFLIKARIKILDFLLYEVLYHFIHRYQIDNPYITYYYLTTILVSTEPEISNKRFTLTKEDYKAYISCLKDETFIAEPMFERLMTYGIFT